jgi:hypothetical protein
MFLPRTALILKVAREAPAAATEAAVQQIQRLAARHGLPSVAVGASLGALLGAAEARDAPVIVALRPPLLRSLLDLTRVVRCGTVYHPYVVCVTAGRRPPAADDRAEAALVYDVDAAAADRERLLALLLDLNLCRAPRAPDQLK